MGSLLVVACLLLIINYHLQVQAIYYCIRSCLLTDGEKEPKLSARANRVKWVAKAKCQGQFCV
jgi:hypothetical protein